MVDAGKMIKSACCYLGTPYSRLDCQALVEKALSDAGLKINLAGSNAWIREVMADGWVGTPEECKRKYGTIPAGAFLFILKNDGGEPAKYQGDGVGNASHIGIYTGMTGAEMVAVSGNPNNSKYNYGDGAINSSSSREFVCTSRFNGKSINGGWNRCGVWNRINYNGGGEGLKVDYQARVFGGNLNVRAEPSKSSERIGKIPNGSVVDVTEDLTGWCKINYEGLTGYVVSNYIQQIKPVDMISVPKDELQEIYNMIGKLLHGERG